MPKFHENLSEYLEGALSNLRRLQNMKLLDDYDDFSKGMDNPYEGRFRVRQTSTLKDFVNEQYSLRNPSMHIEYLRSKAVSFIPEEGLSEQAAADAQKTNTTRCMEELFDLAKANGMLHNIYYSASALFEDQRKAKRDQVDKAMYDIVSSIFSIAITCEYTDKKDIITKLQEMATNVQPIVNNVDNYKVFIVQNIKGIAEVYCDDTTLGLHAINAIRSILFLDQPLFTLFTRIKSEYQGDGDWSKAMAAVVEATSTHDNIIDICDYALNFISTSLFDKEYFGDAMFYMNYINSLGVLSSTKLYEALKQFFQRGSSEWNMVFNFYDDDTKYHKDEYIKNGLPQIKKGLNALYVFAKNHKDDKGDDGETDFVALVTEVFQTASVYSAFVADKCLELENLLAGKDMEQVVDLAIERFNESMDDAEREGFLYALFSLAPCYFKNDVLDRMIDCVTANETSYRLSALFIDDFVTCIIEHHSRMKDAGLLDKIYGTHFPKLASASINFFHKIFEALTEKICCNPDNWQDGSINDEFWTVMMKLFINPDLINDKAIIKSFTSATLIKIAKTPSASAFMEHGGNALVTGCTQSDNNSGLMELIDPTFADGRALNAFYDGLDTVDAAKLRIDVFFAIILHDKIYKIKPEWTSPSLKMINEILSHIGSTYNEQGQRIRPEVERYIRLKMQDFKFRLSGRELDTELFAIKTWESTYLHDDSFDEIEREERNRNNRADLNIDSESEDE